MATMEMLKASQKKSQVTLLQKKNVTGVGIGYKVKAGKTTDQMCLVVLVKKKVKVAQLEANDLIPAQIEGVATDVIEVGEIVAHKSRTDWWRPAPPGVSIGHVSITAGTFGAVVRDKSTGKKFILSNNHVLANSNQAEVGDDIIQPGAADGGSSPQHRIAKLARFVRIEMEGGTGDGGGNGSTCPIANGVASILNVFARVLGSSHRLKPVKDVSSQAATANLVDAAVAEPVANDVLLDEILDIGKVNSTQDAELNMSVMKSGRTTGYTEGTITTLHSTVQVGYGDGKTATFEDQILTSNMSSPGDSGSLLVARDSKAAVGLLFAGSDQVTVHCAISNVMNLLNIDFNI
ncbi:hypothetical protein JXJ21_10270 [candidate division KSB1 bacterium]|nr:hypothetical protein [candidate division KSB1 bacterium]